MSVLAGAAQQQTLGGGGSFVPTDLANLEAWFDADDASTLTLASGSSTNVEQWDDKSGNANHLGTGGANYPQTTTRTINSLDALDFLDNRHFTASFPVNDSTTGAWTILAVVEWDSLSGVRSVIDGDSGGGTRIGQYIRSNGTGLESIGFTGGTARSDSIASALSTGTPYLITSINGGDPFDLEVFRDSTGGGATTNAAAQNYTASPPFDVGRRTSSNSQQFLGAVGEIVCYSAELTGTDLSDVQGYLADKWGITL